MDYDRYKLFVGGIAKETNEEALKQHFSRYGAVLEAIVAKEKLTGQSRGFGFVRFASHYDTVKALKDTHFIRGRSVDVRMAIRKHEHVMYQQPFNNLERKVQRTKKIFVGGLSSNTTEEEFKSYFERFGRTTDVVVMHDGLTNRPRGFGFVTFDSEDSVEVVMQSSFHELSDKRVEVKRAVPKEGIQQSNNGSVRNVNVTPAYSSFQATATTTPYVPEQNGYGMIVQYPSSVYGYNHSVQAFHYPYGYQFTAQVPNVPWNNQVMQPTGFYCAPPSPLPPPAGNIGYLPYMNGFELPGMSIPGYNHVAWTVTGHGTGALIPRFEELKLEVPCQARGYIGKPLQNGAYR